METSLNILVIAKKADCIDIKIALEKSSIIIELEEAINGYQAVLNLTNKRYDCVLLDQQLLEENRCQLINKLQSIETSFPLIIMTDQKNNKKLLDCMPVGVIEYLPKSSLLVGNIEYIIKSVIRLYKNEIKLKITCQKLKTCKKILLSKNRKIEQQQQEINSQKRQILELSRLKSLFLTVISHELRTPMNAIIGFSQILLYDKSHPLTHQQTDMIKRVVNNGKHLLMLLNEILDYAKIDTGKLKLKPEIFDLSNLVHQTVKETKILAEAKNLCLSVNLELENKLVLNDRMKFQQILINLLSNAIKFTEFGNILLKIAETSKNQLIITVQDTGIGIAKQDLPHIFTPFQQIEQGINRKYSGIGIGLATIQSLVKMMGGKIYIESQIGLGTKFQVELPRSINLLAKLPNNIEGQIIEDIKIIKQPSNAVNSNYKLKQS